MTYLQKYRYGLNSLVKDNDGDGIEDYDEVFRHGTNPLAVDTDGDGIPDKWEVDNGLNPRVSEANQDADNDGLTNLQEYQWNLTHPTQLLDPRRAFSVTNNASDFVIVQGVHTNQFAYDRVDRLLGEETSRGVSFPYAYDGNGNLVRQAALSRAVETNGLPVLFSFLYGLTNGTAAHGPYGDADGDGFSNLQEWRAGTNPQQATNAPDVRGQTGALLSSFAVPFAVSNFVTATGQLDASLGEEIVVGADGNATGATNWLLVLTQTPTGWSTQRLDVGPFGITSLAIGQVTNRPSPALYVGLRQTGGTGRVVEFIAGTNGWSSNLVASSTNEVGYVVGVRGGDLLMSLAATNAADGTLFAAEYTGTTWLKQVTSASLSHRGLGTIAVGVSATNRTGVRLLDGGSIEVTSGLATLPGGTTFNPATGKTHFLTLGGATSSWTSAQAYAQLRGGNLATISSAAENAWIADRFGTNNLGVWIGAYRPGGSGPVVWVSGAPMTYSNWNGGTPSTAYDYAHMMDSPVTQWNMNTDARGIKGLAEVLGAPSIPSILAEPAVAGRLLARGVSLAAGVPRSGQTNASVFYAFVDDKNGNGRADTGDDFVLAEYVPTLSAATNAPATATYRQSISAQANTSYAVASVNYLNGPSAVLFTAEPDGLVFAWTASGSNALQRQFFNSEHAGRSWYALSGVRALEGGEALVGLRSSSSNANACDLILWPPQALFPAIQSIAQTAPLALLQPAPSAGGASAQVSVVLLDAEGNSSTPKLEYLVATGNTWSNATLTAIDGSAVGPVIALPSGSTHTLTWNAAQDLGVNYTNTVSLRVRASDVTLTGDFSPTMSYRLEIAARSTAVADVFTILEDTATDLNVLTNDISPAGRPLSVVNNTVPANGTVSVNGNSTLRFTPAANFFGTNTFTYTLSDGAGGSSVGTVTVVVLPVNDPPLATNLSLTVAEDTAGTITWTSAGDPEGDTVVLKSVTSPSVNGGTVTISGNLITYTPALNFTGTDTFNYTVEDNGKTAGTNNFKTATATVTVTVTPVNDAPVITVVGILVLNEDSSALVTNLTVVDVDAGNAPLLTSFTVTNGTLTFGTTNGLTFNTGTNGSSNLTVAATLASLNAALTNLSYRGLTNFAGVDTLRVVVDDQGNIGSGGALRDTNILAITVNQVNDAPVLASFSAQSIVAGNPLSVAASATDVDQGQQLSFSLDAGFPADMTINPTNGVISWPTTGVPAGTYTATVRVTDNGTPPYSDARVLMVTVTAAAQAPGIAAAPTNQTVVAGANVTFGVTASGTAPLSFQWRFNTAPIANATNGALTLTNVTTGNNGNYDVVVTNLAGAITSAPPAVLTVTNPPNYGALQFSAATYSASEGAGSVTISVTRVAGSAGVVGVSFATVNGTATAGSDYTAASGTLSWSAGDSANKSFSVTILEDTSAEGDETVFLSLSNPTGGATLDSPSTATLTITDNDVSGRAVRVVDTAAAAGNLVIVPVQLVSQGDENALGFSLAFDTNLLTFVSASLGTGASGGLLNVNSNQTASGRLGLAVALGFGSRFAVGTQEVARVTFQAASLTTDTNAAVTFTNSPIAREISDAQANPLAAAYQPGMVSFTPGFEGDVSPRPNGSGTVTIVDWVQLGRFAAGLDAAPTGSELRRADTAPRATLGDGAVTITDWVQTGRYAAGLDPLTPVGGPSSAALPMLPQAVRVAQGLQPASLRVLRIVSAAVTPGSTNIVSVRIDSQGNENALGFSVVFDPSVLTLAGAAPGADASAAQFLLNTNQVASGRVGLAVALSAGSSFSAGTIEVAKLTFVAGSGASGSTALTFGDQPIAREISDPAVNVLSGTYENGALTIVPPPSINQHPAGVVTNAGAIALFSVAPGGTGPFTFQWQRNAVSLTGQTNSTLMLTNVSRASSGNYAVTVANGPGSVTSSNASLRVIVAQRIQVPQRMPDGRLRLTFADHDGAGIPPDLAKIEIQATTSLGNPVVWTPITSGFSVVNGAVVFDDPDSGSLQRRYYRIIER